MFQTFPNRSTNLGPKHTDKKLQWIFLIETTIFYLSPQSLTVSRLFRSLRLKSISSAVTPCKIKTKSKTHKLYTSYVQLHRVYIPIALEKVKDVMRKEWNKARLKPNREKSGSDNSMSVFGTLVSKGLHDSSPTALLQNPACQKTGQPLGNKSYWSFIDWN